MKLQNTKGTRDFPAEEKIVRDKIESTLIEVFRLYGFYPVDTPIIEDYSLLSAKCGAGEESDALKEIYTFSDQGKRKLGLRFELTLSTARFVAMNPTLKMPFKRYQIGQVFRDGPVKLGRYREFTQCDVDIFGTKSMLADAECVSVGLTSVKKLGFDAYIEINNRKLLNGLIIEAGISEKKAESIIITIDKLKKQGENEVRKELEQKGIKDDAIAKLLSFFNTTGTNEEKLKTINGIINNEVGKEGLKEIEEVLSYLSKEEKKNVVFLPSLARGLGYYTGTVSRAFLEKGLLLLSDLEEEDMMK